MKDVLMKCGHSASATHDNGKPVCALCAPKSEAFIIIEQPDITGRRAKCNSCSNTTDSNYGLAFFEYQPNKDIDSYYCGCFGWD